MSRVISSRPWKPAPPPPAQVGFVQPQEDPVRLHQRHLLVEAHELLRHLQRLDQDPDLRPANEVGSQAARPLAHARELVAQVDVQVVVHDVVDAANQHLSNKQTKTHILFMGDKMGLFFPFLRYSFFYLSDRVSQLRELAVPEKTGEGLSLRVFILDGLRLYLWPPGLVRQCPAAKYRRTTAKMRLEAQDPTKGSEEERRA